MRVEKTYIANDGKRFKDYQECVDYEYSLLSKVVQGKVVFFAEDYTIMSGDLQDIVFGCKYLYISPDIKNIEKLNDTLYHELGFRLPKDSGYWAYDDDTDKWISVEGKIKVLEKWQGIKNTLSNKAKIHLQK